jgi:hypothetical protein
MTVQTLATIGDNYSLAEQACSALFIHSTQYILLLAIADKFHVAYDILPQMILR